MPQLKRLATAPATWAAATEVPVRVVMGMESWFLCPIDGPLTLTPGAVSYTHLDVYKRQDDTLPLSPPPGMPLNK